LLYISQERATRYPACRRFSVYPCVDEYWAGLVEIEETVVVFESNCWQIHGGWCWQSFYHQDMGRCKLWSTWWHEEPHQRSNFPWERYHHVQIHQAKTQHQEFDGSRTGWRYQLFAKHHMGAYVPGCSGLWCCWKHFFQDNQSAMKLEKNGRASCGQKLRHIDIMFFFMKDRVLTEGIDIKYCPTEQMLADFLLSHYKVLFSSFSNVLSWV